MTSAQRPELPPDGGRPPTHAEVEAWLNELNRYVASLRLQYGSLYDDFYEILDRHDPMGIARPEYPEYDSLVQRILPRMHEAASVDDVQRIVHEEFGKAFSAYGEPVDVDAAGPIESFRPIAQDIWTQWREHPAS